MENNETQVAEETQLQDDNQVWLPLEEVSKFVDHITNMLQLTIESIESSMNAVQTSVQNDGDNNDDN
tara:strand:+ start:390 stop:590 length:201 start_codon:yes stop_codon:yes gene_type:complete